MKSSFDRIGAYVSEAGLFVLIILIGFVNCISQGTRPPLNARTMVPYASGEFETISLESGGGNLMLNFPLASLPAGRGGLSAGINLVYNSKLLSTANDRFTEIGPNGDPVTWQLQVLGNNPYSGWRYSYQYLVKSESRLDLYNYAIAPKCPYPESAYDFKVSMMFPNGSEHEFRPAGFNQHALLNDGYYNIGPNGFGLVCDGAAGYPPSYVELTTQKMVYYSIDGTYMRLEVEHGGNNPYTLYLPDGGRVTGSFLDATATQRIYDRNDNYVEIQRITYNSHPAVKVIDQVGRFIVLEQDAVARRDYVYSWGVNNQEIKSTIVWRDNWIRKSYKPNDEPNYTGVATTLVTSYPVVDQIILPTQLGSRSFTFGHSGSPVQPSENTPGGWGEVESITTPTASQYAYQYETPNGGTNPFALNVLKRRPVGKNLTYLKEYDGSSSPVTETWIYSWDNPNVGSVLTAPDGSTSSFAGGCYCVSPPMNPPPVFWRYNRPDISIKPDGTKIERIYESNTPFGERGINPVLKTEFTSIKDANGGYTLTAIKNLKYDKNGNTTEVAEYDWISYGSVPREPTFGTPGIPGGLMPSRVIVSTYYNPTPDSSDSSDSPFVYVKATSPKLRSLVNLSEVRDGLGSLKARTQLSYDGGMPTPDRGNPTQTGTWDSNTGSSITSSAQYDQFGNPTLMTDANGNQTQTTYGSINGFTGLYPTQTISASGTAIQRTSSAAYDFYTGLVASATDADNGATTTTNYDTLGRPVGVTAHNGATTSTEYHDTDRFVIVRSDVHTAGDQKKVATQFYDQLGRVRLSKTLEDAATQSATNETDGIKVQTRYLTGNPYSYQLSSNPYRAATSTGELGVGTMGWTVSKAKNDGRESSVTTYSGAGLPFEFGGGNGNSTGTVSTVVSTNTTTVTDQASKQRRSVTNALGQLTQVDEPDINGSLTQSTMYEYDTLNNLKKVIQGGQQRTFNYSSLSRLINATNPELGTTAINGTINYGYDNNGNLTTKTDSRGVTTSYVYDALNRVTNRNYTGSAPNYVASPNVTYTYDVGQYAKGRLTKVQSSVSTTEYTGFDILGRVTSSKQTTDGVEYGGSANPMTYNYNVSVALIEQKYPSGRVVKNTLDADGDLATVQSKKSTHPTYWNYAWGLKYNAAGGMTEMQYGNGRWESTQYNGRLQPTQIALGFTPNSTDQLKLNYSFGSNQNNGNVSSQTIEIFRKGLDPLVFNQTYQYDELNRLKEAKETDATSGGTAQTWKQVFTFDRYGNRNFGPGTTTISGCPTEVCNPSISQTNNRITTSPWAYDNAGNTTVDGSGQQFTYDSENKQVAVKNSSNTVLGEYFYDGDGKRVKKYVPATGETTIFVYDASGKTVAEYSTIVEQPSTAKVAYLTNDHLGSQRLNTDKYGNITSRHDYHPYGEEIATPQRIANQGYTAADTVRKQFTGYERDDESGLDFAEARMYSAVLGRFSGPDLPLISQERANPQTYSLYGYGINNPLAIVDPDGHRWYYRDTTDDEGNTTRTLQWVNPNGDGSYTDPEGGGWQAFCAPEGGGEMFIGRDDKNFFFIGEDANGAPTTRTSRILATGAVASANDDFMPLPGGMLVNGTSKVLAGIGAKALSKWLIKAGSEGVVRLTAHQIANIGEVALAKYVGGLGGRRVIDTTAGRRIVDYFIDRASHEAKTGHKTLTRFLRQQIAKDVRSIAEDQADDVTWHFFRRSVTGRGGPSKPLEKALSKAGIKIVLHNGL